jgi:hypothetical protein
VRIRAAKWIGSMQKILPLFLLLLCSSCDRPPIETLAQIQSLKAMPSLTGVTQAELVEIHNDWNGYSDITPILRHYKLKIKHQELAGNAHIAVGGYGANGIHQQKTTKVKIPAAVTAKFLDVLSKTPLQGGEYKPNLQRTDDYPSIEIKITIKQQIIIFSSVSQSIDAVPWKVVFQQQNTSTEYISNSPLPAQALKVLLPYLDRSNIDQIIQRRRQKKKDAKKVVTPPIRSN